jgi:hypothetical protein
MSQNILHIYLNMNWEIFRSLLGFTPHIYCTNLFPASINSDPVLKVLYAFLVPIFLSLSMKCVPMFLPPSKNCVPIFLALSRKCGISSSGYTFLELLPSFLLSSFHCMPIHFLIDPHCLLSSFHAL